MKRYLDFLEMDMLPDTSESFKLRNKMLAVLVEAFSELYGEDVTQVYNTLSDLVEDNSGLSKDSFYFYEWLQDTGLELLKSCDRTVSNNDDTEQFFHYRITIMEMDMDTRIDSNIATSIAEFINEFHDFTFDIRNNTEGGKQERRITKDVKGDSTEVNLSKLEDKIANTEELLKNLREQKEEEEKKAWWLNRNYKVETEELSLGSYYNTWKVTKDVFYNGKFGEFIFQLRLKEYPNEYTLSLNEAKKIADYINKVIDYLES